MFKKGQTSNPLGRPKGSKNSFTKIREDWLKAYHKGGGEKLFSRLLAEDFLTFMKIGVSMVPKEVHADLGGKIEVSWLGESNDPVSTS
jgi:hypothetical protein